MFQEKTNEGERTKIISRMRMSVQKPNAPDPYMKTRRRTQKCLNRNIKQQLAWRCASLVATCALYKPSHTFSAVLFTPPFTRLYSKNLHYAPTWFGGPKSSIFHSMKKDGNSMECLKQNSATKYAWSCESLLATLSKKKGKTLIIMILGLWESGSPKERLFDHMDQKKGEKALNGFEHLMMPGRYLNVASGAAILLSTLSFS
jgi:hypothetical protein